MKGGWVWGGGGARGTMRMCGYDLSLCIILNDVWVIIVLYKN